MKKLILLFLLTLTVGMGQIFAQDLFFSEYVEGSGNSKAVEIYNGTGAAIDMSEYTINRYSNGSAAVSGSVTLAAVMLADGAVYVVANPSSDAAILAVADETSGILSFNGDDAVELVHNGTTIDVIGEIGNDPGSEWGAGLISTQNNTIRRLPSIMTGDADGFGGAGTTTPGDISSEWEGFAQNTFGGLGTHTVAVAGVPQLLITEIIITPTSDEFIEIYNPTGAVVDLTDVYLTDATFAGGGTYYYNVVTGANAGGGGFGDFHARFPNGSSIAAGEYQTVSLNGSDGFFASFGVNPTYELFEDAGAPDAIPDMLEAIAGSINNQGGFTNSGEVAVLYHWDGTSDNVTDLDYALWGDTAEAVDKTGISTDGPDADAVATAYLNDTPIANQEIIDAAAHAGGKSYQRKDLTEGTETQAAGNGAGGHNETSENLATTWGKDTDPTPNAAYVAPVVVSSAPSELLLSEVVLTPANEEYIEIYNPTTGTIVLTDVYITDATHSPSGNFYYNVVTGANAGGGDFTDFHARFPNAATIAPGEYQTVALNGAADFVAAYGQDPTYELYAPLANAIPDMVEAFAGSINYPANEGGLADGGEIVSMYYWDGATDLVTDLDYIMWGDNSEAVDKTGISVDGPDADAVASAYLNDTGTGAQDIISNAVHAAGKSFQRIDDTEGTETFVGGNGAGGHNETSENLSVTWFGGASPTPNGPYVPFLINEVDATVAAPENTEFIEIFDRGVGGNQSLNGYIVVLFDGTNDLSYRTFDLNGLQTDANGYFLIGGANVAGIDARVTANTGLKVASADWLQNGADAVTIYRDVVATFPNGTGTTPQNLMDALVYDTDDADDAGLLVLLNAGQAQINENLNADAENHSMQRIANGTGGPLNTSTYKMSAPTDGAVNFAVLPPSAAPTKLLLSEIILTPTDAEYIEIFNPTTGAIDLTDVYLSDATFTPNGVFYSNLPSGSNAGGGGFGDFNARFPNGATIAAGEYQTVALNGANEFFAVHGQNATYELYENSGANAVPDMLEATVGSINGQGGLSSGEVAVLYYWDGATDLVSDLDYAVWGDKNEAVDKTGETVDGPDADAIGSTYLADTDVASQAVISVNSHVGGKSYQRIDMNEGTETLAGGNGVQGHDETSENLPVTWFDGGNPTPNAGFIPFVINEVDADVSSSPEDNEFIEIFDGGIGNFSLDGYSIVLYNGSDDQSYGNAFDLDGLTTDANGYFVIGGAATPNVDLVVANNFLQNGADAVALYKDDAVNFPNDTPITMTNLIDAMVYDTNDGDDAGLLVLITSGSQVNEGGNGNKDLHSSQRIPNGSGGLRNTNAYTQIVPTPGEMNFAITTIAAARAMADGTLGVTIEGNLTAADELGTTAYIQDATGGIALYNGGGFNWGAFAIGDKLRISGDRASFNDQKQMSNLTIISLGTSTILVPLVIDLTQMDAHRGELVKIDALHFPAPGDPLWGNSNFTLTSGADNGIMRVVSAVTDLTNKSQPAICDVIGIMGNYQNTSQLLPRRGSDLPCAGALTVTSSSFSPQTLDVVAWNIEHFGAAGLGPVDDNLQASKVVDVILALDADIYALEEISNDAFFISDVLPSLPGYAFELSPFTSNGSTQNLAFLYKTSVVTKLSARGINIGGIAAGDVTDANFPTGNKDQHWASGRFPYMMTTDVNVNGSKERVNFIVIHGKAFNDNIAFQRREFDATALHDSLSLYMPNDKIIVLGDYNDDLDVSISIPDPSPYAIFDNDVANYKVVTKSLSLQGKRSTVSFDNMIDHISMTNELFSAHMVGSENVHYEFYANDPTYDNTTSDHHPVSARFAFPEISINSGTALVIANNGNADIGTTTQPTDLTQTFTINNDGLSDLVIVSLSIAGADLTISAGLAPNTTILAGQTASFEVTMDATTVGIKSATIVITNNDGDEGTYTIDITGEVKARVPTGGGGVVLPPIDYTIVPPTQLIGTPISTTVINLDWTDNSDNENGYYVYQNSIIIATIAPNSEFFAVTGLTPNTFYNFRVEAFNGVTIARSNLANVATLPLDATVGQSIGVCGTSGVSYIQMTGAPQRGSYRWYADSVGGTPIAEIKQGYFETPVLTQSTTFYVTAVSSHGLESNPRQAVTAYVYQDVEAELLEGNVVKSCDAKTTLHALEQVGATYQWRINGALSSVEGQEFEATFSGRYQLIVTRNSCVDTYGFDVKVNYKPTAIINDAQTTAAFCQSGSLLAAKTEENASDATYEWLLNGNVITNGTSTNISESGTYTLRVTENTCVNEAQITITVFDLPQNQTITASATDFCIGDEVTLTVPSMTGVNYRWFKNGRVIGGENSNTYVASIEAVYSVEMFIDNLNCSAVSQSVAIANFVSPEVELTRDENTISLEISIPHQTVEWFTTGGEALPQFANQTSISPDFGEYWAVITYPTGCTINSNSIRFYEANPNGGGIIDGLDDEQEEGNTFEVFPNPSNDGIFHIRLGNSLATAAKLSLTDALGRDLNINISIPQGAETLDLDLSEFAEGMYYLQFISSEGTLTKKIIKQ